MFENKLNNSKEEISIEKQYKQYLIQLKSKINELSISISQNQYNKYASNLNLDSLHNYKLFSSKESIKEIIEYISSLIDDNKIQVKKINEENLSLVLISSLEEYPNIEISLNKKPIIEILIDKIDFLQNQNKILTDNYGILKERLDIIENENKQNKIEIENQKKEIEKYKDKIEELESRLDHNENSNPFIKKKSVQLTELNLKLNNTLPIHKDTVTSISTFPSGNIISVSNDFSIKIFNGDNYNIIQEIENAHESWITYVSVIDENNFVTCSTDESIKIWNKKDNIFRINQNIENAHYGIIMKIIYCSNGNLISCSDDNSIKIWKENFNQYKLITKIQDLNSVKSILFLEDRNRLISSGKEGTTFWGINIDEMKNYKFVKKFDETYCNYSDGIERIDRDTIIVGGSDKKSLKIISVTEQSISKKIKIFIEVNVIKSFEDKGVFLIGSGKNIYIYRSDNYDCIGKIKNAHEKNICGFVQLKNDSIGSFSSDKTLKIWYLKY